MFKFFMSGNGGINPDYWSEKLEAVDRCDGHLEYCPELFCEAMKEECECQELDWGEYKDWCYGIVWAIEEYYSLEKDSCNLLPVTSNKYSKLIKGTS